MGNAEKKSKKIFLCKLSGVKEKMANYATATTCNNGSKKIQQQHQQLA